MRTPSKPQIFTSLIPLESAESELSKDTILIYFECNADKLTFLLREILIFSEFSKLMTFTITIGWWCALTTPQPSLGVEPVRPEIVRPGSSRLSSAALRDSK
jgi:hypothetical protein